MPPLQPGVGAWCVLQACVNSWTPRRLDPGSGAPAAGPWALKGGRGGAEGGQSGGGGDEQGGTEGGKGGSGRLVRGGGEGKKRRACDTSAGMRAKWSTRGISHGAGLAGLSHAWCGPGGAWSGMVRA